MLVDQARANVKDIILAPFIGKINKCATIPEMVQPTVTVIRDLAKEILVDHHLYLSTVANPQEESKELVDDLTQTVKMLQTVINAKNEQNVKEVAQIETARQDMLAALGVMRKSSMNSEYLAATEQMVAKMQGNIFALLIKQARH